MKPKVFISYSHRDVEWKNRLVEHLNVLVKEGFFDLWEDNGDIEVGDQWREEIDKGLTSASAAVFMISRHFLTSDFIKDVEVKELLQRRENEEVRIFPVIVSPCAWDEVEWIRVFQVFNRKICPALFSKTGE